MVQINSTLEFDNETARLLNKQGFDDYEKGLITFSLILLVLAVLFGNSLVIGIFCKYRPIRTVTNYFIVSLATADILVGLLSIPIWITYIHYDLFADAHGMEVYRFWVYIDILTGVASVLNLTLVSIDRYVRITMGLQYYSLFTSWRVKCMVVCSWMYATSMALIKAVFFEWERPNYEIFIFTMGFGLPLFIMGICHFRIFKAAHSQAKKVRRQSIVSMDDQRHELKAIVVLVIVLVFVISWSPFFLVNLSYGLCQTCKIPGGLITISKWLHYSNSVFNPIIYAMMNREFRSAFCALLSRRAYQIRAHKSSIAYDPYLTPGSGSKAVVISLASLPTEQTISQQGQDSLTEIPETCV
eukprot:gene12364-3020_t